MHDRMAHILMHGAIHRAHTLMHRYDHDLHGGHAPPAAEPACADCGAAARVCWVCCEVRLCARCAAKTLTPLGGDRHHLRCGQCGERRSIRLD